MSWSGNSTNPVMKGMAMYSTIIDHDVLTANDIAGALRTSLSRIEGFFGPSLNAEYKVWYDIDTVPDDFVDCFGAFNGLYSYSTSRGCERFQIAGCLVPENLINAWNKVWDVNHDIDYTERVMVRYAALFGYTVRTVGLIGNSQGDWADCVIFETAQEHGTVNESFVEDLFAGRIYTVEVSLEGPGGEQVSQSVSGIVGYDDVSLIISDLIVEACGEIIRERKA